MATAVTVRMLGPSDAPVLTRVADGVFDNAVDPRLTAEFLADARHHMAVAIDDGVVVGMASGVDYIHPDKPVELWVNEIGVATSHRQRGIGKQLLQVLFDHARALGCTDAWLGTEVDNTAARRLYAAAEGEEEIMVYVTFELDDDEEDDG